MSARQKTLENVPPRRLQRVGTAGRFLVEAAPYPFKPKRKFDDAEVH